jgi:tRNA threonylcarbamoyladenosine biosynthesis protein TsaB
MLLALDTATRVMSIALHDGEELRGEYAAHIGNRQTTTLAPKISDLMADCDVSLGELTALAVSVGPGSYTGVRIGVAMGKGMAAVHQLPLIGVSTLDTLAAGQPYFQSGNALIAVVQAGRGRIIVKSYRWRKGRWTSRAEPRLMTWVALLETIDGPAYVTGEINEVGMEAIHSAQENEVPLSIAPAANRLRRAGFLAESAWEVYNNANDMSVFEPARLHPVYIKSDD